MLTGSVVPQVVSGVKAFLQIAKVVHSQFQGASQETQLTCSQEKEVI
jgi:hypothetical protein